MHDLHSHIIWAVDDGSKDLNITQQMLITAAQSGTTAIFATSHIIDLKTCPPWELMEERCQQLNAWCQEKGLNLTVYPGGEVYMNWELLSHLTSTQDYRLAHSRYMLVELPMREIPVYAEDFFYQLRLAGITPILAHPERYAHLLDDPHRLLKWRQEGLLLQINGGSLTGFYGKTVQARANWLLANNLVDFIGSDAHSTGHRNPDLSQARNILQNTVTPAIYESLTKTNPESIINNKEIELNIPKALSQLKISHKRKKSFWQRLFG